MAAKVQVMEPKAVFIHCYGQALNLAVSDTIKKCVMLKDCLDTCYELVKLIKWSPKRDAMLRKPKKESLGDAPSIHTLCPIRWTVRAESLKALWQIIATFKVCRKKHWNTLHKHTNSRTF